VKAVKPELTPEQMLADMGLHARSSVVHVEPPTVAAWRECIGQVLCGAAFDAGLAQGELLSSDDGWVDTLKAAVGLAQRTEREACALALDEKSETWRRVHGPYWGDSLKVLAEQIRARGAK